MTRQVLAEPEAGLAERTWATLADGTPLVTAAKRGKGMIVLFHVTADTRWSDLPLSGTFVEMLRRIVGMAGTDHRDRRRRRKRAPSARWCRRPASSTASARSARRRRPRGRCRPAIVGRATADHPPGFYGPPEGLLAVNTLAPADRLARSTSRRSRARLEAYQVGEPQDLRGPVLLAALGAARARRAGGVLARRRARPDPPQAPAARGGGARARGVIAALTFGSQAFAQDIAQQQRRPNPPAQSVAPPAPNAPADLDFAMKATIETRLAYVVTGDAEVDGISKSGLQGLTLFLAQRTALEAGEPVGLDIARDELAFFPLIYWPIVPGAAKPSPAALARIDAYMKHGGTVLFDTRDAIMAPPGPGGDNRSPGMLALRDILSSLDIPELEPVPRDHVLTKTFFLLRDFPGRFNSGQLWVEALPTADEEADESKRPARAGDGVSSIIITLERSCRRLGDARRRPADAAAGAGRAAPARVRLPRRRQHRDVHADRQLQGRPGARAGAAGTAGTIGAHRGFRHHLRAAGSGLCAVGGGRRSRSCSAALLAFARSRGWAVRALALALMVLALANPSFTREDREPLSSVVAVVVDKSPSQNFGDRAASRPRPRARCWPSGSAASPASRCASSRPARPTARPTARGCSRRSARRSPTCRPTASPAPS